MSEPAADVVDDTATHLVGDNVLADPSVEGVRLREWAGADSAWLRCSAIISQVGAGVRLDQALPVDVMEPDIDDRNRFSRKAGGQYLRGHARHHPDWVRA